MKHNYIIQLKAIQQTRQWPQAVLARELDVTLAALNRWMNGHVCPRPAKLKEIAALYRQTVEFPSYAASIQEQVRKANSLRISKLWQRIKTDSRIQDELILEHTYNSTSIEGTSFTKRESETVIFSKSVIPDKSFTEHLEVTNHAAVLRRILQGDIAPDKISENLIREIHRGLLQGIREDAGNYSKHQRAIRGVDLALTHPEDIGEEMAGLIRRWKRHGKVTIREIAVFHSEFELIHPFGDGNGRTGRLLMMLQCLQSDFPPVVVENSRKIEYYETLEYAQKKSEGPLVQFLTNEMEITRKLLTKYWSK